MNLARMLRGGVFIYDAPGLLSWSRDDYGPLYHDFILGSRCARTP